jgi:aminopeptidase N
VLVASAGTIVPFDVTLDRPDVEIPEAVGLAVPAWVLPAGGGLGYGLFRLDALTTRFLATSLHTMADPLTRGAALVALWEAMLEGDVSPEELFEEVLRALPREADELNLQQWLDDARALFWRFIAADERPAAAARLEPVLRDGLARATTQSQKAAWFAALRSVALTPRTVQWMEQLWRRDAAIPGLVLAEPDEADLAADLALRDVPDADGVLQTQLARFVNPDRRARFAFLMPALSGDAATRAAFFERLRDPAERRHEAWVVDAARYLHHPLRAASSRRLVVPALGLLSELQRTGDIFFPKRWADATLSGYQSVQTAADVRAFIDSLPTDYPERLRWVLLSAADPLFRAARLQQ